MTHRRKNRFTRDTGSLSYKKLFFISTEGRITEPEYFGIFNNTNSTIDITCVNKNNKSAPKQVLKKMKETLKKHTPKNNYEAWIIIDKDFWNDNHINEVENWAREKEEYNLAISKPSFEYWLLLHFEDGNDIQNLTKCNTHLKKYLPYYDKHLETNKFNNEMIRNAINRARTRHNNQTDTFSTLYLLVEKLV